MTQITKDIVSMLDMLPEQDQTLAYELVKKLVLAWDSDFTKVTSTERVGMAKADEEIKNGEVVGHDEIDWN